MRRLPVVIALFIAAFTASAGVTFRPPAPTTQSFVMLHVSNAWNNRFCDPLDPVIERSDRTFDIRFTSEGCIPEQIGGWAYELPLGTLEPGSYVVRFWHNEELQRTDTFAVRLADPPVKIFPSYVSTRGGTRLVITEPDDCGFADAVVLIDGVEVPAEEQQSPCATSVITPAHAAGSVDVAVRTEGGGTFTAPVALRYVDPAAPVDPSVFERLLIPILYNGPGAFGSQWVTEAKVEAQSAELDWFHDFERAACDGPCSTPPELADFRDHPAGMIVTVPRPQETLFSLRIRDVSRNEISYGTEVPIARETDFRPYGLVFADVPFDPRYRLTLRLYSMTGVERYCRVQAGGESQLVRLAGPCAVTPCASVQPSFAAVDLNALFPALAGQGPRRVSVDHLRLDEKWGFITVTNNETQQVTVISPMR